MKIITNQLKIENTELLKNISNIVKNHYEHTELKVYKFKKYSDYSELSTKQKMKKIHLDIKEFLGNNYLYKHKVIDEMIYIFAIVEKNNNINGVSVDIDTLGEKLTELIIPLFLESILRENTLKEIRCIDDAVKIDDKLYIVVENKPYGKLKKKIKCLEINFEYSNNYQTLTLNLIRKNYIIENEKYKLTNEIQLKDITYKPLDKDSVFVDKSLSGQLNFFTTSIKEFDKTLIYYYNLIMEEIGLFLGKNNIPYTNNYFNPNNSFPISNTSQYSANNEILIVNNLQYKCVDFISKEDMEYLELHLKEYSPDSIISFYKNGERIIYEDLEILNDVKNYNYLFLSDHGILFNNEEITNEQSFYILENSDDKSIRNQFDFYTLFKFDNLIYKNSKNICQNLMVEEYNEDNQTKIQSTKNHLYTISKEIKLKESIINYKSNHIVEFENISDEIDGKKFSSLYVKSKPFKTFNVDTKKSKKHSPIEKIVEINFIIKDKKLFIESIVDEYDLLLMKYIDIVKISDKEYQGTKKLIDNQFYLIDKEGNNISSFSEKYIPSIIGNEDFPILKEYDRLKLELESEIEKFGEKEIKIKNGKEIEVFRDKSLTKSATEKTNGGLIPLINTIKKTKEIVSIEEKKDSFLYFVPSVRTLKKELKKSMNIYCGIVRDEDGELIENYNQMDIYKIFLSLITFDTLNINENSKTIIPEKLSKLYIDN